MNGRRCRVVLFLLVLSCAGLPSVAQDEAPRPGDSSGSGPPRAGELQREIRKFFADQLRADLDLTDEQTEQIMPRLQQMERERGAVRRERTEAMRGLRRGIEHGASDAELQEHLDRLDGVDRQLVGLKEQFFADIDTALTVRQRVRLRFFVERFPRMMREKILDLRRDAAGRRSRGRPSGGRGGEERP